MVGRPLWVRREIPIFDRHDPLYADHVMRIVAAQMAVRDGCW